jgi:hypothetical protein
MRKITLHRPKESLNKNCSYEILVGNRTLTELKNGEEKIIEIPNEFIADNFMIGKSAEHTRGVSTLLVIFGR